MAAQSMGLGAGLVPEEQHEEAVLESSSPTSARDGRGENGDRGEKEIRERGNER
jgi:hypothetical protein